MSAREPDPLYVELKRRATAAGFFRPDPWGYVGKALVVLSLYSVAYVGVLVTTNTLVVALLLVLLAQMSVQLAYLAHDAGHGALTKNARLAWAIGHFGMTFITGFSFSWWMYSHDNHHDYVNEEENDLAMQYSTVLSVHENAVLVKRGWKRRIARWQAYYIWFLIPLYHFPMIVDGFVYVARNLKRTRADQVVLPLYLVLWFVIPAHFIGWKRATYHYLADTLIGSTYIALTFIVHHIGRKVVRPDEHVGRFRQQIEATRTVRTWRVFDFYYSGLNYHVPHHLFSNVPHWRYRALHELLREFCREKSIRYEEEGFVQALRNVFRYLDWLGRLPSDHRLAAASTIADGESARA